jgi:trk system potassium uptake protein TrkA
MFVIVAGAGRTGAQLAKMLITQGYQVHLIDHRKEILARVHKELPTEVIFEGDPVDPSILEAAGIERANVLAACTTSDETNLSLCYFVRERYGTKRTIARVNNPRNAWLFDQKFHVDVALNQAEILARLIEEEMSMGDMVTLMKLRRGNYSLVEEKIPPGAEAIGIAIKDLQLPDHCVIAAILRHGEIMIPRGITTLEAGDEVLAVTNAKGAEQLAKAFNPPVQAPKV